MADPLDQLESDLSNGNVFGGAPATGGTDSGLTRTNAPGPMPADWEGLIQDSAKRYGVPPTLLKAVLQQESGFNSNAIGPAVKDKRTGKVSYAQGAAQFLPDTAAQLNVKDPFDPGEAIPKQAQYLRQLLDTHGGDLGKALNVYSGGAGAPYVKGVYDKYQKLGGDPGLFVPVVPSKIPAAVPALAPSPVNSTQAADTSGGLFGDIIDGIKAGGEPPPVVNPPHETTNPTAPIVGNLRGPVNDTNRSGGVAQPTTPGQQSGGVWGDLENTASAAVLGAGGPIMAGTQAVKNAILDMTHGVNPIQAFENAKNIYYPQAKDIYDAAHADYKAQNPAGAFVSDVVGSTPTTVLATEAAGGQLGNIMAKGRELLPELGDALAPVGRFLAGKAGAGGVTGGRFAQAGNKILQTASKATNAAEQGAAAGAMNTGTTGGNPLANALTGGEVGGVAGVLAPVAGAMFKRFAPEVNPEVANLVTRLQKLGIDVKPNQFVKGGPGAALGPMGGDEAQLAQHTAAVARTMGSTAAKLTPDVMSQTADDIAGRLNNVAAHTRIDANDLMAPLGKIETEAMQKLPTEGQALPYIRKQVGNILDEAAATGGISGDVYQSLTRYNGAIGRMINSTDPDIAHYGIQLRGALDDALEKNAPPGMMDQLKTARSQWKNMLIAEKAVDTTTGVVDPKKYAAAAKRFNSEFAYQPSGDVNTIARSAPFMPSPTAVGGVKTPSGGLFKSAAKALLQHPVQAGVGALGLVTAAHEAAPVLGAALEHPLIAGGFGIPALLAAGGRKLYQAMGNTQAYKSMLLRNAGARPPWSVGEAALRAPAGINKVLVPATTTAINRQ